MKQRDCFFTKKTHAVPSHLWVVVSDPDVDGENVLIVNLTDANGHHDHSCVLDATDHPGVITKRSCVAYQFANLTSIEKLTDASNAGLLSHKAAFSEAAFQKILDGAQESDELKNAHRVILRQQFLI